MTEAFYVPDGDRYVSTEWTRGPWSADSQHAGPPAALVGRAIERLEPAGMSVARLTLEILRPIPVRALRLETRVIRPGSRVQLVEATLADDGGEVCRASAWRIRTSRAPLPEVALDSSALPAPEDVEPVRAFPVPWDPSYLAGMEWRPARGEPGRFGPAAVWMRMRVPLVDGEEPSGLQRVLAAADSGNGISMVLDPARYVFVNTDLTVQLVRPPVDEWVCLDAVTRIAPSGVGAAESVLWDRRGRIGSGRQTLYVSERSSDPGSGDT